MAYQDDFKVVTSYGAYGIGTAFSTTAIPADENTVPIPLASIDAINFPHEYSVNINTDLMLRDKTNVGIFAYLDPEGWDWAPWYRFPNESVSYTRLYENNDGEVFDGMPTSYSAHVCHIPSESIVGDVGHSVEFDGSSSKIDDVHAISGMKPVDSLQKIIDTNLTAAKAFGRTSYKSVVNFQGGGRSKSAGPLNTVAAAAYGWSVRKVGSDDNPRYELKRDSWQQWNIGGFIDISKGFCTPFLDFNSGLRTVFKLSTFLQHTTPYGVLYNGGEKKIADNSVVGFALENIPGKRDGLVCAYAKHLEQDPTTGLLDVLKKNPSYNKVLSVFNTDEFQELCKKMCQEKKVTGKLNLSDTLDKAVVVLHGSVFHNDTEDTRTVDAGEKFQIIDTSAFADLLGSRIVAGVLYGDGDPSGGYSMSTIGTVDNDRHCCHKITFSQNEISLMRWYCISVDSSVMRIVEYDGLLYKTDHDYTLNSPADAVNVSVFDRSGRVAKRLAVGAIIRSKIVIFNEDGTFTVFKKPKIRVGTREEFEESQSKYDSYEDLVSAASVSGKIVKVSTKKEGTRTKIEVEDADKDKTHSVKCYYFGKAFTVFDYYEPFPGNTEKMYKVLVDDVFAGNYVYGKTTTFDARFRPMLSSREAWHDVNDLFAWAADAEDSLRGQWHVHPKNILSFFQAPASSEDFQHALVPNIGADGSVRMIDYDYYRYPAVHEVVPHTARKNGTVLTYESASLRRSWPIRATETGGPAWNPSCTIKLKGGYTCPDISRDGIDEVTVESHEVLDFAVYKNDEFAGTFHVPVVQMTPKTIRPFVVDDVVIENDFATLTYHGVDMRNSTYTDRRYYGFTGIKAPLTYFKEPGLDASFVPGDEVKEIEPGMYCYYVQQVNEHHTYFYMCSPVISFPEFKFSAPSERFTIDSRKYAVIKGSNSGISCVFLTDSKNAINAAGGPYSHDLKYLNGHISMQATARDRVEMQIPCRIADLSSSSDSPYKFIAVVNGFKGTGGIRSERQVFLLNCSFLTTGTAVNVTKSERLIYDEKTKTYHGGGYIVTADAIKRRIKNDTEAKIDNYRRGYSATKGSSYTDVVFGAVYKSNNRNSPEEGSVEYVIASDWLSRYIPASLVKLSSGSLTTIGTCNFCCQLGVQTSAFDTNIQICDLANETSTVYYKGRFFDVPSRLHRVSKFIQECIVALAGREHGGHKIYTERGWNIAGDIESVSDAERFGTFAHTKPYIDSCLLGSSIFARLLLRILNLSEMFKQEKLIPFDEILPPDGAWKEDWWQEGDKRCPTEGKTKSEYLGDPVELIQNPTDLDEFAQYAVFKYMHEPASETAIAFYAERILPYIESLAQKISSATALYMEAKLAIFNVDKDKKKAEWHGYRIDKGAKGITWIKKRTYNEDCEIYESVTNSSAFERHDTRTVNMSEDDEIVATYIDVKPLLPVFNTSGL